jgi:glycosyltransferase involved in cell wall biosynthesis
VALHVVGPALTDDELSLIDEPAASDVTVLSHVSDDVLAAEYAGAACLLMLSRFEGFGWPVLEAASSGKAALCSDIACLKETGGDGAIYISNVSDEQNWTEIATALVSDNLRSAARRNAAAYSLPAFSSRLHEILSEMVPSIALTNTKPPSPDY